MQYSYADHALSKRQLLNYKPYFWQIIPWLRQACLNNIDRVYVCVCLKSVCRNEPFLTCPWLNKGCVVSPVHCFQSALSGVCVCVCVCTGWFRGGERRPCTQLTILLVNLTPVWDFPVQWSKTFLLQWNPELSNYKRNQKPSQNSMRATFSSIHCQCCIAFNSWPTLRGNSSKLFSAYVS